MNIESNLSGHWTDEQLIEHLYGIGPNNGHLDGCGECRSRLSAMQAARRAVEGNSSAAEQVPFDLLAAQRRNIYARIDRLPRWELGLRVRRWVAAGAMIVLLSGGALMYERAQEQQASHNKITDAQLAQQVSQIATDSEPGATAPLQQLFDE
jgi:hypothetical protein